MPLLLQIHSPDNEYVRVDRKGELKDVPTISSTWNNNNIQPFQCVASVLNFSQRLLKLKKINLTQAITTTK